MLDCRFASPSTFTDQVVCSCEWLQIADRIASLAWCEKCPAKRPRIRGDFFAQTSALLVQKQIIGEYLANPKPCGGCSETKHRIPDGPVTQFVWPYWDGGASGDELRWSIRSVETFFQGRAKITLIGDRPEWYHGHCIRKKRVPASKPNRAFRDMLSKVFFIASHAEIDSECVWMMDDIYFLKPFTLDDIKTPRAEPWRPSTGNSWQRRKTASMAALAAVGRTQHDYATHLPHWLEKQKLRQLFEEFNLHHNTMLWEVLYGNTYRDTPQRTRPFFSRLKNQATADRYRELTKHATVLNHIASAWCDGMREFLSELLPNPSAAEGAQAESKPNIIIRKKVKRVVKRRHPSTWKVNQK
jgi:hypothetical protein